MNGASGGTELCLLIFKKKKVLGTEIPFLFFFPLPVLCVRVRACAEVSVSFDMESSVTYTFQEPFSVMQNRSSQASSVSTESSSRAREDVAFSFATSQRPAMLLTVSTFSQQYIAVILARNGA